MSDSGRPLGKKQIHLDPVGGVAGDMFIAAVLHAFPELREGMLSSIRSSGFPPDVDIALAAHRDHALTGLTFAISEVQGGAGSGHQHRSFSDIRRQLQNSALPEEVCAEAIAMFTLLAGAEAQVHGMPVDEVSFHELGEWDSIADIVGAAYLIRELNANWSVGPLPLGGGRVATAHGPLPVPAPATALLLEGFDCFDDGVSGERVTPTGAVILRHLGANCGRDELSRRLLCSGTGFGKRRLPGLSNVLRLLAFEEQATSGAERGRVTEILFEVDDQTGEDLAIGLEETTTIGLRCQLLDRVTLQRREQALDVDDRLVGMKAVTRGTDVTVKPEAGDVARVRGGHAARDRLRRRALEVFSKGDTP